MKTLILTAWTENMASVIKYTSATKKEYAELHNYEYHGAILPETPYHYPAWGKLALIDKFLKKVDRLLWIDADAFITNPSISLDQMPYIEGLTASRDWAADAGLGDFSSAGMILTQKALPLLELALTKTEWANRPLWDQNALREAATSYRSQVRILPRRSLNAVPKELHPWAMEPWQPGDFLCHLTNKSNEERHRFLEKYFEKMTPQTVVSCAE